MKVLLMTSWYPSKDNSINGIFVQEQVKALLKVGVKPIVFYPLDSSIKANDLQCTEEDGVVTYRANTYYLKNSKMSLINSIFKSFSYLKKIEKDNPFDLIHCHVCYPVGFAAYLYKLIFRKRYIITEHMSTIPNYAKKLYNRVLFKAAYGNAEKVVTVSSSLCNELKGLGFTFQDSVIGNVVDCSANTYERYVKDDKSFKILFVGTMDSFEVKGLNYFIPALAKVINDNKHYNITFSLVGDGVMRQKYEEACKVLDIYDKCKFYGIKEKKDIPQLMVEHDFLVLPSKKETFGCVLIESMAAGKPVLSTKCGGPEDFVIKEVGLLVEPKNEEALEDGLKYMINNYIDFNNSFIREYAINNYSYEAIGRKLKNLYKSIL